MIDRGLVLRATGALIAAPSENPPDDPRAAAEVACRLLHAIPGVVVTEHTKEVPIQATIAAAQPVSEPLSGASQADTLARITVNLGLVSAGISPDLVPDRATAGLDIRLPPGTTTAAIFAAAQAAIADLPSVSLAVRVAWEPTVTDPTLPLFATLRRAAARVLGTEPVLNLRVGASDPRLVRLAGIPTAVFGPTPHGIGGGDECVMIPELIAVAEALAASARDILGG
jgi:acetylornithine deacetylase/succinyl-diaminopimelate desuccinylase-like protein